MQKAKAKLQHSREQIFKRVTLTLCEVNYVPYTSSDNYVKEREF